MIELIDEFQHKPVQSSPLWWENYHFNGYDSENNIGISLYTAIKPILKTKEDIVIIHTNPQVIYQCRYPLGEDNILTTGNLKMEPLVLLEKWRIHIAETFEIFETGTPTGLPRDVAVDLFFEAETPPYGFTTGRGKRYEQIGRLHGEISLDGESIQFGSEGMRDHSWELRNIPSWGEWYWLMGRLTTGDTISFICAVNEHSSCDGWCNHEGIKKIRRVEVDPIFSSGKLEKCHAEIMTDTHTFKILIRPISSVSVTLGEEQKRVQGTESLVSLNDGDGYGFFWYGP